MVSPTGKPSRDGLLALLLVGAVLLCHGFLGALHQIPDPQALPHLSGEHSSHAPAGDYSGHPEVCLGHPDYAALVSVLFGALLGLLLGGIRERGRLLPAPRLSLPPLVLHPPRGPTAPLVQVFRL